MKKNSPGSNANIRFAAAASFVLLLLAGTAAAQWSGPTSPNNNIYYNSGNVGIGTQYPADLLNVKSGTNGAAVNLATDGWSNSERGFRILTNTGGASTNRWKIGSPASGGGEPGGNGGTDFGVERFSDGGASLGIPFFIQRSSGNVGIGTTSPSQKLHLFSSSGNVYEQIESGGTGAAGLVFKRSGASDWVAGQGAASASADFEIASSGSADFTVNVGGSDRLRVKGSSGNVGIGKTDPQYKLDVLGNTNITGNLNIASAGAGTNTGNIYLAGTINAKYQDVAEWVPSSEKITTGTVVVLDTTK